jgi:glutathione peroxidase
MSRTLYDFTVKTIDGRTKKLSDYKGRPVLVVNVASACGLTPQYAGLEKLHELYAQRGLAVLGFPANEFGAQEPGTDDQIQSFCTTNYGVKFDMFSKVVVKGAGIHPLFQWLTDQTGGDIQWNFGKFLIGKDGTIAARFEPRVEPGSAEVKAAIEKAL